MGSPQDLVCLHKLLRRRPAERVVWGLERMKAVLRDVGDPHTAFRSIHIAGTNGKGSTAACLEALLRATGVRTGLYTSPHLESFDERIRVDRVPVAGRALEAAAAELLPAIEAADASWFEAVTALGFLCLARAEVDWAVIETGLGGRLDATNVLVPELSLITNVALDHAEYLGSDLEDIAREKAGIMKAGVPTVLGRVTPNIRAVFAECARGFGAPLGVLGESGVLEDVRVSLSGTRFVLRTPPDSAPVSFSLDLPGEHQAENAALALLAAQALDLGLDKAEAVAALKVVSWPGRFQWIQAREGPWVLDVAHNPAGAEALARTIELTDLPRPLVACVAILGDKDWEAMLEPLLVLCDAAVFTSAPSSPPERRWDPVAAARRCSGPAGPSGSILAVANFEAALSRSRREAGEGTVIVTGSCFTVGDALRRIRSDVAKQGIPM